MDTSLDGIKFKDSKGEIVREELSQHECEERVRELAQSYFEAHKKIQALNSEKSELSHKIKYLMESQFVWSAYECYIEVEYERETGHVLIQDKNPGITEGFTKTKVSIGNVDYIKAKKEET
tara:strand:+ start:129 stop:491 length:363 start_codon:yes stop_codon:yes gene_type:complete